MTVSSPPPAGAEGERVLVIQRGANVGKGLMKIQIVEISRTRAAVAIILERALQLAEDAEIGRHVQIGMKQVTLEQEAVVV